MGKKYKNPSNGYVETASSIAWLWVSLWAPIYFAVKGIWTHAILSLVLGIVTFGISNLVYVFLANSIIRKSYLKKGWQEIESDAN